MIGEAWKEWLKEDTMRNEIVAIILEDEMGCWRAFLKLLGGIQERGALHEASQPLQKIANEIWDQYDCDCPIYVDGVKIIPKGWPSEE